MLVDTMKYTISASTLSIITLFCAITSATKYERHPFLLAAYSESYATSAWTQAEPLTVSGEFHQYAIPRPSWRWLCKLRLEFSSLAYIDVFLRTEIPRF